MYVYNFFFLIFTFADLNLRIFNNINLMNVQRFPYVYVLEERFFIYEDTITMERFLSIKYINNNNTFAATNFSFDFLVLSCVSVDNILFCNCDDI